MKFKPYKGFVPQYTFCHRTKVYCGNVINSSDSIVFSAADENVLLEAFEKSVDNYLYIYALLYPVMASVEEEVG